MEGPVHREGETAIALGDVIAGRYRVLAPMGAGGMATVHRAEDVTTGRRVAIKVLRPEIGRSGEAVERLRREAEILGHLRHPAIVAVERSGTLPNGQFFLCMELLEGETLGDRMRRGRMDVDELAPIVAGATAGLAAAHDLGVVHRDLKPDNVFLAQGPFGAPMQVKLLDFGISKVIGFDRITRTGQVLGTPRYMAPEQLTADRDLDGRVDVYALGVILYEALAGQPPFPATDPSALIVSILSGTAVPLRSLRPDLPADVDALVARAMARAPEARHASAAELGVAFAELAATAHGSAPGSRAQMRTSALGAMSGGSNRPPPPGAPLAHAAPEPFKPSTFSEFAVVAPPREPVAPTAAATGAAHEAPGAAARAVDAPAAPHPPAFSAPAPGEASATPRRSLAALGIGLAVLAVLALAVAGGVFAWYLRDAAAGVSSPPRLPTPRPPAPGPAAAAQPSPDVVAGGAPTPPPAVVAPSGSVAAPAPAPPAPEQPLPEGVEAPAHPPAPAAATTRAAERSSGPGPVRAPDPRPRRSRSPERPAEEAVPPPYVYAPADEAPAEETAASLLRAARVRQRAGDFAQCIDLGQRAIELGAGPTAHLLLGDCHLASGQVDRAGKAYERFCRAMPSHPAVLRVVDVVARTGGRCD